jgi:DNA repair photolyase
VGVNVAPVIPFLTDSELESILEAAKNAGATSASYILMRLPWEVKDLFREWLQVHFPLKADHVMSRVHQMRGGKDNDPRFGSRMKGEGLFAQLLQQRFDKAYARLGFDEVRYKPLDTTKFAPPSLNGQASLF